MSLFSFNNKSINSILVLTHFLQETPWAILVLGPGLARVLVSPKIRSFRPKLSMDFECISFWDTDLRFGVYPFWVLFINGGIWLWRFLAPMRVSVLVHFAQLGVWHEITDVVELCLLARLRCGYAAAMWVWSSTIPVDRPIRRGRPRFDVMPWSLDSSLSPVHRSTAIWPSVHRAYFCPRPVISPFPFLFYFSFSFLS